MLKKQEGDLSGQSSEQGKWRNEFRMKGVTVRPGVYWKGCRGFCAKGGQWFCWPQVLKKIILTWKVGFVGAKTSRGTN